MAQKPVLIVVAGPNGSGKTSLTEKLLQPQWMAGCIYVNPDRIAQDDFGDWNSPDAVLNAARKAQAIRESCLGEHRSLAFESVLSAQDKIDFILRAKDCAVAAVLADRAYSYDNSVENAEPRLLFKTGDGSLRKVYSPINSWAHWIAQSVQEPSSGKHP